MAATAQILELSARDIARKVGNGDLSAVEVTTTFLDHIEATDGPIMAWQHLARDNALVHARGVDKAASKGTLAGVPVGVKDVIDTADMPTGYGSRVYDGFRPAWDAPCVTIARGAGGVVLGKTVSTEFAMMNPNKTRNPHNTAHTPGGSSSGSCAAVAAGHARLAFGTQTSGSVVRPASFCGVVGFKPTFGLLNRTAVKVLCDNLDTLGIITRDVRDAAWCTAAIADNPGFVVEEAASRPTVGLFRTSRWDQAEASSQQAVEKTADLLSKTGATVREIAVPDWFDEIFTLQDAIMGWEVTQSLAYERKHLSPQLGAATRQMMHDKSLTTIDEYMDARRRLPEIRNRFEALLDGFDALITPAAPGEAPEGMPTGDPLFNRAWTVLHSPCLSVPATSGPKGLPVGVQVVGRRYDDRRTLSVAAAVEDAWKQERGNA